MASTCRICRRVNPLDAMFCYYDGVALDAAHASGPLAAGVKPFHAPFVLPSGRSCRTFDELVMACDTDWEAGKDVLVSGFLEGFLGGLGRVDLAMAARQASKAPDNDLALDDFLTKLPSTIRGPAKLQVDTTEFNLGEVPFGSERRWTLELHNGGAGLLHGTVSCASTPWLAVGDLPAGPQKYYKCRHETTVPVQLVGKALRAGSRPLVGKIVVESNGGMVEIPVTVSVPVKPYPDGLLAGAKTPRQIAEKSRAAPKEAAPYFSSGAVAGWYATNGWTYPIQGPAAFGIGAVQQFFEALGLVTPPKVTISTTNVEFKGAVGATLDHVLEVETVEKRPVFAHAISQAAWLQVGKISILRQTARIPLIIPSVPSMPGETLEAQVLVSANGNQRFSVKVTVAITPGLRAVRVSSSPAAAVNLVDALTGPVLDLSPAPPALPSMLTLPPPPPIMPPLPPSFYQPPMPELLPIPVQAAPPPPPPLSFDVDPVPFPLPSKSAPFDFTAAAPATLPTRSSGVVATPAPARDLYRSAPDESSGTAKKALLHALPLCAIVLGLGGMLWHDYRLPARDDGPPSVVIEPPEPPERNDPLPTFEAEEADLPINPSPYLRLSFHNKHLNDNDVPDSLRDPTMRFGLLMLGAKDPKDPRKLKRLTFHENGLSNNVCIRVDGKDYLFGQATPGGGWIERDVPLGKDKDRIIDGRKSVWATGPAPNRIVVTQIAEIVPSEPIRGETKRRLDTCLIHYEIKNEAKMPHKVGLRFLLDTYIGTRDGVPFTIPGQPGLCDTEKEFNRATDVPDFIEVLENDDPVNPGTVARVQFHVGKQLEAPERVVLGGWPNPLLARLPAYQKSARGPFTMWEVPHVSMQKRNVPATSPREKVETIEADSCVTLYWDEKPLGAGQTRKVGFGYGLGSVSSQESGGKLLLSVGGRMARDVPFTLTALVSHPDGESLSLSLPDGFCIAEGQETQKVPPVPADAARQVSTVTWKLLPTRAGEFRVKVTSSKGPSQTTAVTIRESGNLQLAVSGRMGRDTEFTLTAFVWRPADGEKLTLTLPDDMKVNDGQETQTVPRVAATAERPVGSVTWKLQSSKAGEFPLKVTSSQGNSQTIMVTIRPRGVFD
jgi:hypothetical protein